jgi:hypothetical protein
MRAFGCADNAGSIPAASIIGPPSRFQSRSIETLSVGRLFFYYFFFFLFPACPRERFRRSLQVAHVVVAVDRSRGREVLWPRACDAARPDQALAM